MGKVATSPLPPRGSPPLQSGGQNQKCPKKGGNATSPLHYGGSLAKGTKSKVAELGARTKLWMCSPKEYHQKKFRTNDVCASKNTLKTPPQTIFKKGEGFSNPPTLSDFSEPPPLGWLGICVQRVVELTTGKVLLPGACQVGRPYVVVAVFHEDVIGFHSLQEEVYLLFVVSAKFCVDTGYGASRSIW